MKPLKRLGMAIPTALFMALLVYFLSTILTWTAQMNQRFTSGEAERAFHSFVTRGEVNEYIARFQAGSHSVGDTETSTVDGFEYHTRSFPDPSNNKIIRVVCETQGKQIAFTSARSMVETDAQGMILYTDTGGVAGPPNIRMLKMDEGSGAWQDVVPVPQQYFTDAKIVDPVTGADVLDPVTGLPTYNPDPTTHVLKPMVSPEVLQNFAAYGIGPSGKLIAIYEPPTINAATPPKGYPTMFTYDPAANSWSVQEISGGYVPTGLVNQKLGGTDGSIVIQDADGLMIQDPNSPNYPAFTRVPNPPGGTITTSTTGGGSTYAQMSNGTIQVFDGANWSQLVSPNGDFFSDTGEFTAGSGPVPVSQISVSPNGSITALWQRNGVDTVFRYVPGDTEDPPHWDATLPLTLEDSNVPMVSDLSSIAAMPGRFLTEVPGPPQQIFVGRTPLPSPGANAPIIATGIYTLAEKRYYPSDFSTY